MTSAKITLGVATIITLASLATAVNQYHHACVAEQALANAVQARPGTPTPSTALVPQNPSVAAPASQPEPVRVATTAPATAPAKPATGFGALMEVIGNPAIQKQTLMSAKVRLDGQYGAFFKSANLTPEQVEQFKNLIIEKQMVGFDSMTVARQNGIEPGSDPQSFFRVVMEAQHTVDAQIATLLGADAFSRFQQFQETIPARNTSTLLEQALSYTATPLTNEQTYSVVKVLTQYGTTPLPASNPFSVLNSDLGIIQLNEKGLTELQGVLSAPQVQVLQAKMQEHQQLLLARESMAH
jgi:hypothetical protein